LRQSEVDDVEAETGQPIFVHGLPPQNILSPGSVARLTWQLAALQGPLRDDETVMDSCQPQ
jgi:hypothetical protein